MRLTLGSKPRLLGVLALTVAAAIAIIAGISGQSAMLHPQDMSAAER